MNNIKEFGLGKNGSLAAEQHIVSIAVDNRFSRLVESIVLTEAELFPIPAV